jgi:hypothetical protein
VRLGGSKTNEFCSGEGEGCCDEDIAETLEAIVESSWGIPILATNVTTIFSSTTVDDCSKDTTYN